MSVALKRSTKLQLLIVSIVAISILHFSGTQGMFSSHGLHSELFFIPILLSAFWFGLKLGFLTSILVSILFLLGISVDHSHSMPMSVVAVQIVIFVFVAALLGWLSDSQRERNRELIEAERLSTLGRTAGVLGWEIRDHLDAMRNFFDKGRGLKEDRFNKNIEAELSAMDELVVSMTEYAARESLNITTVDLNEEVGKMVDRYKDKYQAQGVNLELSRDVSSCPSKVDPASIAWVISRLLDNALDISKEGNSVFVSTKRHGDHCTIEVEDQGVGISDELVCKIFTPFFTTKEGGSGISLAACKKTMREAGGDITARSEVGSGTSFTVVVPRKNDS